ncbi:MAG: TonB-dependent receptor [Bacteroidetes bacterium]|nr:TonB-dependent receptor [Bacteroidota bacterium]MDA1120125.1 TonB-dependent receptor [Bacteroidota bacterium]
MRKTVAILFFCFLSVSQVLLAQEKVKLLGVLDRLEEIHNIRFAYDFELISQAYVDIPNFNISLDEMLSGVLGINNLSYEVGDRVIIIAPTHSEEYFKNFKSHIQLSGFVKDTQTGEGLPNATVYIISNKQYTTTNLKGFFALANVPYDTSRIEIKFLGYHSQIIRPIQFEDGLIEIKLSLNTSLMDEITVTDEAEIFDMEYEAGRININPHSVQLSSGLDQPDIIRSIQLLPGVVGTTESSSGLSIRGGGPDQNLIMFDGFTVYSLDHFFGSLSAFNSNVIQNVSLYKSGFGAKLGSRVSSVIDIRSRDGSSTKRPRGNVGFDMMSANMMMETSLNDKISILIAGRRSYTDFIRSNVFNSIIDNIKTQQPNTFSQAGGSQFINDIKPDFKYYDLNAKATVQFKNNDQLRLSFYNSHDGLIVSENKSYNAQNNFYFRKEYLEKTQWGNTGLSMNYHHEWNPDFSTNLNVAGSSSFRSHRLHYLLDYGYVNEPNNLKVLGLRDKNEISEVNVRIDNIYRISDKNIFEFGLFNIYNKVDYHNVFSRDDLDFNILGTGTQTGLYAEHSYSPLSNLSATVGIRATYFSGTDYTYLEPRFSFNYTPYPALNFKASVGKYYQFVNEISTNNPFLTKDNYWLIGDGLNVSVISSNHYAGGFTYDFGPVSIDVEGYYKTLKGLTTYGLDSAHNAVTDGGERGVLYSGSGEIIGMDVMLHHEIGKLTNWLSYSLSSVRHQFMHLNNGEPFSANQDQRHEMKYVSMFKTGNWEISGVFIFGSGRPYSGFPFQAGELVSDEQIIDQIFLGGAYNNNLRIPAYHRLDLSVAYTMNFGKYTDGKIGISLFNLYNHKNIKDIRYDLDFDTTNEVLRVGENRLELLGFTPSLFVNFYF